MHIALALIGILGAFGYWFFAAKRAGDAAAAITDAAGRARGAYRRRQFAKKADASRIDAVNDPRTAAAIVAMAIASGEDGLSGAQERTLREAMAQVMQIADPEEYLVFARWALGDGFEANNVTLRLSRLLNSALSAEEKGALVAIVRAVVDAGEAGAGEQVRALGLLSRRLGLAR